MEVQKIPKNIRQIGGIEDWVRVYVEDYVATYIHRLHAQGSAEAKYGVLLGKKERVENSVYLFLSGAMETTWEELSQERGQALLEDTISQRFPGMQVWGWFLCDGGGQDVPEEKVEQIFRRYFQKEYQTLFWQREQEADFYVCSFRGLERLKGYHIYYERNEEMQEYMILSSPHFKTEPVEPKEELVDHYRKIMKEKKPEALRKRSGKNYHLLHAASLICVFFMGVMAFYGRQDIQTSALVQNRQTEYSSGESVGHEPVMVRELQANLPSLQETEPEGREDGQREETVAESSENLSETEPPETKRESEKETPPETEARLEPSETEPLEISPPETEAPETLSSEPVTQAPAPDTYQVKRGDTLQKISMSIYGNEDMINAICEKNEIKDPNYLFAGQVLLLP